ncbi:hypothetical protein BD779DRAFT_1485463 [Infundibulicybe gibba]|nr:hypothetical protein BD779DRAFT_1485463 [Infundibulicybe gibba]
MTTSKAQDAASSAPPTLPPPPFSVEDPSPKWSADHPPLVDFDGVGSSGVNIDIPPEHAEAGFAEDIEEPPPEFGPYVAESFEVGSGDIVSHDPHLNTDGEALYRFLLSESATKPYYIMRCQGTHSETRTRWVTARDANGRSHQRSETYTETVHDFDFYIRMTHDEMGEAVHWSVPDAAPVFRGAMVREVEGTGGIALEDTEEGGVGKSHKRKATRKEKKAWDRLVEERSSAGLPPWVERSEPVEHANDEPLRSSKSLRQWADEYCSSPKILKEFMYEKVPYGWNISTIENAVRSNILSTGYHGTIRVDTTVTGNRIYIRPDNRLSRMLSNKWIKFLSIILLIFPFIWLFKRFHARGGGRWAVCGGAYAVCHWDPAPHEGAEEHNIPEPSALRSDAFWGGRAPTTLDESRVRETPEGRFRRVGLRENEWIRDWTVTIRRCVGGRYCSPTIMHAPAST